MSEATALLQQYLAQLAARSVTHVPLTARALSHLNQAATPPTAAATTASATATPSRKSDRLAALAAEAGKSPACRALGTLRETLVFSSGSAEAELMFIGEAPGAEEELKREPFVGPAGQLLAKIIQAAGFKRSDVYISNVCKFRPIIEDGSPQAKRNRPPTPVELAAGLPFITEEIRIIQPRVIVALGALVSHSLGIDGNIADLRGKFHEFQGIPVMVTHNPSHLLHCGQDSAGVKEKRLVWEDLLQVLKHLGRPISAKQRAYFTNAAS
ncbi:MAG: uracil-DNA glycosylase [Verrucomicrobia bacterium]|nr:uracil-DNA glycosylase [Verrucomicrobiota bacterium]